MNGALLKIYPKHTKRLTYIIALRIIVCSKLKIPVPNKLHATLLITSVNETPPYVKLWFSYYEHGNHTLLITTTTPTTP